MLDKLSAKFAVFQMPLLNKANELFQERLIVLKNEYGVVVYFTRLELYAGPYLGRVKTRMMNTRSKHELEYICCALNYIFGTYSKVNTVCRVTADMIYDFFDFYRNSPKPNGEFRSQQSLDSCIWAVSNFFANVAVACKSVSAMNGDIQSAFLKLQASVNQYAMTMERAYKEAM